MQTVVALVQALAWPLLVLAVFVVLRREVKQFLAKVGQVHIKAPGGFEATAAIHQELQAAASLGAAAAKSAGAEVGEQDPQTTHGHAKEIASVVSRAAAAPNKVSGAQVLWVDDRPENNIYERQSLEALGLRFTLSRSTEDALDKVRSQSFDAIISDMGRPPDPRAGYTLLDQLREGGVRTPFIIYAGSASPEHRLQAAQRGAFGTTNRPQDLFKMVIDAVTAQSA
jgi:CheY-like chemotaxis protein